jgi:hypothetical protein
VYALYDERNESFDGWPSHCRVHAVRNDDSNVILFALTRFYHFLTLVIAVSFALPTWWKEQVDLELLLR